MISWILISDNGRKQAERSEDRDIAIAVEEGILWDLEKGLVEDEGRNLTAVQEVTYIWRTKLKFQKCQLPVKHRGPTFIGRCGTLACLLLFPFPWIR